MKLRDKILSIFVVIVCLTILTYNFTVIELQVSGDSMHPTLKSGEQGYSVRDGWYIRYNRFDIVTVTTMDHELNQDINWYIKRIIALPGETILYEKNKLYINGEYVEEPFLEAEVITYDFGPLTLGDNEVFVVGDNREHSTDSRFFGALDLETNIKSKGFYHKRK